jgi:hypothetical protein
MDTAAIPTIASIATAASVPTYRAGVSCGRAILTVSPSSPCTGPVVLDGATVHRKRSRAQDAAPVRAIAPILAVRALRGGVCARRAIRRPASGDRQVVERHLVAQDMQHPVPLVPVNDRCRLPGAVDGDVAVQVEVAGGIRIVLIAGPRQHVDAGRQLDHVGTAARRTTAKSTIGVGRLHSLAQRTIGARFPLIYGCRNRDTVRGFCLAGRWRSNQACDEDQNDQDQCTLVRVRHVDDLLRIGNEKLRSNGDTSSPNTGPPTGRSMSSAIIPYCGRSFNIVEARTARRTMTRSGILEKECHS